MKKNHLVNLAFLAGSLLIALEMGVNAGNANGSPKAPLPFVIYKDKGNGSNHYAPSGWMGNTKALAMNEGCAQQPHGGVTCLRFEYKDADDWAGVVWQEPANDWGEQKGGYDLTGAKKLTFWARGEKGGEIVTFKFGILGPDKKYPDSSGGELNGVKLTREWKKFTIDIGNKDMSCIKTGFAWTVAGQGRPVVFYLDDIQYE